jgi:hypothetical protein
MPRAQRRPAISHRFTGGVSGAWLIARWLLVLALVFDQVSAPFHHHQHDGVDAQLELAVAHAVLDSVETHVDSDDHEFGSHSATAIRVDASRIGQLPAVDPVGAVVAVNASLRLLAALDEPVRSHWVRDRSTPDFRSHRSLPPAGRAPPLHA